MAEHYQQNLSGKLHQRCKQCGNEEYFLTTTGICQRCDYNNIYGGNISKKQIDFEHEEFMKVWTKQVDEGSYIWKRRCSVCKEHIEIPARDDIYMEKVRNFMDDHRKKHSKEVTEIIEDYNM